MTSGQSWASLGLLVGAVLCAGEANAAAAARTCPPAPAIDPAYELGEISGSGSDAWAIGTRRAVREDDERDALLHWDGCAWEEAPSPFDAKTDRLMAVWAKGREVWLSGTQHVPRRGDDWDKERDRCPRRGGRLFRRGGTGWEEIARAPGAGVMGDFRLVYQLWGSGGNDVWMLERPCNTINNAGATVEHWDGKAVVSVGPSGISRFGALWGSGPRDVWVGGEGGVARRDGPVWQTFNWETKWILAFGGTGPSDVWVRAGAENVLRRWDGSRWTELSVPSDPDGRGQGITWLGGVPGGHLFATGADGNIYRAQGATLSVIGRIRSWTGGLPRSPMRWRGLVVGRDELWLFVGAKPLPPTMRWSKGKWTVGAPEEELRGDVAALWADGAANVWAAFSFSVAPDKHAGEIRRWDGAGWKRATTLEQFPKRFWGLAPDDVWLVGAGGAAWHWDGKRWTSVPTGTSDPLFAVWGAGSKDVWTAGEAGVLFRWDGTAWRRWSTLNPNDRKVVALGGSGPDFVLAAGQSLVARWDGRGWIGGGPSEDRALGWNGTADVQGVWGSSPKDFWLVGTGGDAGPTEVRGQGYYTPIAPTPYILHWDGKGWKRNRVTEGGPLRSIMGTATNDVWAVGDHGTVLRWNGSAWSSVPSGTEADLLAVAPTRDGWAWIGGAHGTLQRLPSP